MRKHGTKQGMCYYFLKDAEDKRVSKVYMHGISPEENLKSA